MEITYSLVYLLRDAVTTVRYKPPFHSLDQRSQPHLRRMAAYITCSLARAEASRDVGGGGGADVFGKIVLPTSSLLLRAVTLFSPCANT